MAIMAVERLVLLPRKDSTGAVVGTVDVWFEVERLEGHPASPSSQLADVERSLRVRVENGALPPGRYRMVSVRQLWELKEHRQVEVLPVDLEAKAPPAPSDVPTPAATPA